MLKYIKGVKNALPFYYFERISEIPRASRNEKAITDYIEGIAREHGLDFYRDEYNNILVTRSASKGRENDEAILLQAHTDMVAEKNVSTVHDFSSDPISLIQDGSVLRANGTTLGADDGFGVSCMLALLTDALVSCPRLECLFTSSEEIGLIGASKFDYSKISARRMINLDSAEEDYIIIGCCGGVRTELTAPVSFSDAELDGYKITVGGLCGGHSGEDIDKGRLNSNIVMGKILNTINEKTPIRISEISGGDRDNAIPRECEAIIAPDSMESAEAVLGNIEVMARELIKASEDSALFVRAQKVKIKKICSYADTSRLLEVLSVPNGVLHYRKSAPIIPETSRNLARIRTLDNELAIGFSSRSYLEYRMDESTSTLDALAEKIGASTHHHERYQGWESPASSALVLDWQRAFRAVTGKEASVTLIHAGLECGLICAAIDGLCAISVGCNVHNLHTPSESMELDSMDRIYDVLKKVLE